MSQSVMTGSGPETKKQLRANRADQIDKKWVSLSPRLPSLLPTHSPSRAAALQVQVVFQVPLTPLSPF